jgi:hypothetical protein
MHERQPGRLRIRQEPREDGDAKYGHDVYGKHAEGVVPARLSYCAWGRFRDF